MTIVRYAQIQLIDLEANLPTTAQVGDYAQCLDTMNFYQWDGGVWVPSARTIVKKSGVTVDGKTVGTTKLYTLEASKLNFYPVMVIPRVVLVGTVVTAPTVSVGTVSPNYTDIANAGLLGTLLATLGVGSGVPQLVSASPALAGGTAIYAKVTIAAAAANYQVKYDVLGFYDA